MRQRMIHVFGIPIALGGITAAVLTDRLHGKAVFLGAIVAAAGILLIGWYVVSGLDRGLVAALRGDQQSALGRIELANALASSPPEIRSALERIRVQLETIEESIDHAATQGTSAIVDGLRDDLIAARRKAIEIARALPGLHATNAKSEIARLETEVTRLASELDDVTGALHEALGASKQSVEAELARRRAALDHETQLTEFLGTLETELEAVKGGVAGGVVGYEDGERLRKRLASTIATCDRLLQQAGRDRSVR